jgi:hypothetical protein
MDANRNVRAIVFLRSGQFWGSIISTSIVGFIFGTVLSIAALSSTWPRDVFAYSTPFVLTGIITGYLGWKTGNHPIVCVLVAFFALWAGFCGAFWVADRLVLDQNAYNFSFFIFVVIAWVLLSAIIAFVLFVSIQFLVSRLSHMKRV